MTTADPAVRAKGTAASVEQRSRQYGERNIQIRDRLRAGATNAQIARDLGVSLNCVAGRRWREKASGRNA